MDTCANYYHVTLEIPVAFWTSLMYDKCLDCGALRTLSIG